MWRSEPAPIQTRSWPRSSPAISTCATPGAGKGATPPGSNPVAARTSSGRATRAYRVPAAAATLFSSARRSPGTRARVGRPSQTKTRDLTICAREAPTAFAAASAVGVPSGNSSTRASMPARLSTSATRATGSGQRSTTAPYPGATGSSGRPLSIRETTSKGDERERPRAEGDQRGTLPGRERADCRERRALRLRGDGVRLRMCRRGLHAPYLREPRGVRGGARRADDVSPHPRARAGRHRAGGLGPGTLPRRGQGAVRRATDSRPARSAEPASAAGGLGHGAELEHAGEVEAFAPQPLDELGRRRRVDRKRHQRLAATPAARDRHAGDVDPGLSEQRSYPADHARHVVVAAEHEERRELELDLEAEDVDEPRSVVAADRRPGHPDAGGAVPQLHADEVRVVAGRPRSLLAHVDPALCRDERRVDVVHGLLGAALEGAVEHRDREQARVVVREGAVDREHDLLGRAVGKLHGDAPEPRRERHVGPEHLEVVGADDRDVDRVRYQPALERGCHLLGDDHARPVLRLPGGGGQVRGDDDVVELEQRAGVRLVHEDVERRAGDLARAERREERVLVEQWAAGGVDDPDAGTHRLESAGAHRAARLRRQRQVQREEVRDRIHVLGRLDPLGAELAEALGREVGVIRDDVHPEAERTAGHLLADPTEAEDAERLAGELDPAVCTPLPAALLERGVGLRDVAGERHEEADRVLGGGDDRGLRCVRHDDPAPRRRVDVDVVDAHARPPDHLEAVGALDHVGSQLRGGSDDDRVVAADDLLERAVGIDVHVEARAEQLDPRVGDLLANQNTLRHVREGSVLNASSAAVTATPRSTSAPRSARTSSTAPTCVVMSKTSNQPMWPRRKILPFSSPWPFAIVMPKRSRTPRITSPESIPAGARTAVTTALRSSSGEKRSRPSAFTPARAARPRRGWRSNAASRPSSSRSSSATSRPATSETGSVTGASSVCCPLRVRAQSK